MKPREPPIRGELSLQDVRHIHLRERHLQPLQLDQSLLELQLMLFAPTLVPLFPAKRGKGRTGSTPRLVPREGIGQVSQPDGLGLQLRRPRIGQEHLLDRPIHLGHRDFDSSHILVTSVALPLGHADLLADLDQVDLQRGQRLIPSSEGIQQVVHRRRVGSEVTAHQGSPSRVLPEPGPLSDHVVESLRPLRQRPRVVVREHRENLAEPADRTDQRYGGANDQTRGVFMSRSSSSPKGQKAQKAPKAQTGAGTVALGLRLTVGPMLAAHGYKKVTGPGGLNGTGRYMETLGLRPGAVHAGLAAGTEIGAGGLLTLGALSPLPAAGVIGVMATAARTAHKGKGFMILTGGWEYTAVVAAIAAASAVLGSGPVSVDRLRGKRRSGARWGVIAAGIGLGAAAGLMTRVNAPADDDTVSD